MIRQCKVDRYRYVPQCQGHPQLLQELAAASQPCQAYVADEEGLLVLALFADASFALIRPQEERSQRGTAELLSVSREQLRTSLEAFPCSLQLVLRKTTVLGGADFVQFLPLAPGEAEPLLLRLCTARMRRLQADRVPAKNRMRKGEVQGVQRKQFPGGMFDYGTLASVEKCTSEELAEKWLGKLDLKDSGPQPGHQPGHVLDREDFRRLDAAGNQRYIDGVAQVYDTYGADWTQLCAEVPGLEGMCQSWPLLMEKRLQGRTLLGAGCAERSEVH
ncbi:hypothetical protein AK812_SmicGene15380 [Symbiodinium microadriaticum]|uniref:Uncharacterized protein n=1 Tax=Symbiodinium microadriaticum TaxID=2951 RepID=A0A1Q9E353_SYMMI|nr:hypothetical protein AK812_SmicGene15380 [Symbiodinium microadriaticum]